VSRLARAALAIALASAVLMAGLALSGCGPSKADVSAQQRDECFANQKRIKLATDLVNADTGIYPDIASVVAQLKAVCPSGGAYSFDPKTDTVSCSVHGSAPASASQ
jgi:hypothetical protein